MHDVFVILQDSLRKKQQPPVSSTPVAVSSPQQQTQNFSSPASVTHTAQPTVQSLQQPHIETNKEVSKHVQDRLATTSHQIYIECIINVHHLFVLGIETT